MSKDTQTEQKENESSANAGNEPTANESSKHVRNAVIADTFREGLVGKAMTDIDDQVIGLLDSPIIDYIRIEKDSDGQYLARARDIDRHGGDTTWYEGRGPWPTSALLMLLQDFLSRK